MNDEYESREKFHYRQAGNPRFWEGLNYSQRYKKRTRYEAIIERFSTDKIKETIKQKVVEKWHELLKSGDEYTSSIGCKYRLLPIENTFKSEVSKRVCLTCGNDISNQRKGSVFCSEKLSKNAETKIAIHATT